MAMVTIEELNKIREQAGYARFVHTNLHMHTPATPWDWDAHQNQTYKASDLTPEKYFEYLNKTSLELVAMTDHNCVNWCKPLIDLAREGRKSGTSKLHILPGIEITTYEGPHILAIFDEETDTEELREMLKRLGMSGDGLQSDKVGCRVKEQKTIEDVFEIVIEDNHGLVIAPHIHSKDGVFGAKSFKGREKILNDPRLRILAAVSGDIKRVNEADGRVRFLHKSMDTDLIHNSFSFINVSDCHRLDDFEVDTTWIKMCDPSLEGAKQIIYEPELRVCHRIENTNSGHKHSEAFAFATPDITQHPHIIGIAMTGGMLDEQMVAFSPSQNSVIGKNYSGKSSLLDCIRFVMDELPSENEARSKLILRLRGILGEGGQVRAYVQDRNGNLFGISRVLSCSSVTNRAKEIWQVDGRAEIHRLIGDTFHMEPGMMVGDVIGLEIYPQGEVVRIKDNVSQQLHIVDSLAKHDARLRNLSEDECQGELTLRGRMQQNGIHIAEHQKAIDEIEIEVSVVPEIASEISRLELLASSPLLGELAQWGDARSKITGLHQVLEGIGSKLVVMLPDVKGEGTADGSKSQVSSFRSFERSAATIVTDIVEDPATTLREAIRLYDAALDKSSQLIRMAISDLNSGIQALQEINANCTTQYEKTKRSVQDTLGASDSENAKIVLLERIEQKRSQLRTLHERNQELEKLRMRKQELVAERAELLTQYSDAYAQIRKVRREVVQLINQDSSDSIQAELAESVETGEFYKALEAVAERLTSSANRITNRQGQLTLIVNTLSPSKFLEYVRRGNVQDLTSAVGGLTENTARILMGMGMSDIHQLELSRLGDRFVVMYRREGDSVFTPIDAGLSGGEQALALISVAMVGKPMPLVIDQPEDELGQALITRDLVESIRKVKAHRQLIFVTHVPNIPVLADSEQVIYMQQIRKEGKPQLVVRYTGSLDHPEIIRRLLELDGGRLAMEKRYERYAPHLSRKLYS